MPVTVSRLRSWYLAILALALLLLGIVLAAKGYREHGRQRYEAQVAARRAVGQPTNAADLFARLPPLQPAAQAAWIAWARSHPTTWSTSNVQVDRQGWDRWIAGRGPRPAAVIADIERHRAEVAPGLAVFVGGNLLISTAALSAPGLTPGMRSLQLSALQIPSLLQSRDIASWLRYAAVVDGDLSQRLAEWDGVHAAFARPTTLIDAMIGIAIADLRDWSYLDLALLGRLDQARLAAWLAEPCPFLPLLADAFEGDVCLFIAGSAALQEEASIFELGEQNNPTASFWERLSAGVVSWTTGYHDIAAMAEWETGIADRLRGTIGALPSPPVPGSANLLECARTALEADARHRIVRLVVRILSLTRETGLPRDQAALLAAFGESTLLAPPGDHLQLAYERLADDRFRLTIDPASPAPNFDDPTRMRGRSTLGAPTAVEPLVYPSRTSIELRIPPRP